MPADKARIASVVRAGCPAALGLVAAAGPARPEAPAGSPLGGARLREKT